MPGGAPIADFVLLGRGNSLFGIEFVLSHNSSPFKISCSRIRSGIRSDSDNKPDSMKLYRDLMRQNYWLIKSYVPHPLPYVCSSSRRRFPIRLSGSVSKNGHDCSGQKVVKSNVVFSRKAAGQVSPSADQRICDCLNMQSSRSTAWSTMNIFRRPGETK